MTITRHTPIAGRCNAPIGDGEPCDDYPVPGSHRCAKHGGYATGPRTPEGRRRSAMRGIKHGMYVNQLASYMQALDIPQDLWEALPTDTDLSPEIKVLRANVLRYSAMLSRGVRFIYSDNEGILHEIKPKADSAGFIGVPSVEDIGGEMGTQRVILSVDVLLGQTLDQLRKMVKTQNDVKPGGDIAGDFRFVIEVSDNAKAAADEPEVPVLVEDEAPITTTTSAAAKADLPKRNKPSRGWDDE